VNDALVKQMNHVLAHRETGGLVFLFVIPPKEQNGSIDHELTNLGKLRVDDRNDGGINVRILGAGHGRRQDGFAEGTPQTDQIDLLKEFLNQWFDSSRVEPIDGSVDDLPLVLPRFSLRGDRLLELLLFLCFWIFRSGTGTGTSRRRRRRR